MPLKDKNGNPISTEGVDEKVVSLVEAVVESQNAALEKSVVATVGEKIDTKLEGLTTSLTSLTESVKQLEDAATTPPKHDDKDKPDPNAEKIAELEARVRALSDDRAGERSTAECNARIDAYLAEKLPNLGDHAGFFRDELRRAAPKDDATMEAAVAAAKKRVGSFVSEDVGKRIFSADPVKEGAEKTEADEKANERKKIETIRKRGERRLAIAS